MSKPIKLDGGTVTFDPEVRFTVSCPKRMRCIVGVILENLVNCCNEMYTEGVDDAIV